MFKVAVSLLLPFLLLKTFRSIMLKIVSWPSQTNCCGLRAQTFTAWPASWNNLCNTTLAAVITLDLAIAQLLQLICVASLPTTQVPKLMQHAKFFSHLVKTVHIVVTVLRGGVQKSKLPRGESTITTYKVNCRVLKLFYLLAIHFSYTYASFFHSNGKTWCGTFHTASLNSKSIFQIQFPKQREEKEHKNCEQSQQNSSEAATSETEFPDKHWLMCAWQSQLSSADFYFLPYCHYCALSILLSTEEH